MNCKHCDNKLNLLSPDNYTVDKSTNDVYCNNKCLLEYQKQKRESIKKKDKFKISWKCPNCEKTTNHLPFTKTCDDCGVRFKTVKKRITA
jgi:hypothetical protein